MKWWSYTRRYTFSISEIEYSAYVDLASWWYVMHTYKRILALIILKKPMLFLISSEIKLCCTTSKHTKRGCERNCEF